MRGMVESHQPVLSAWVVKVDFVQPLRMWVQQLHEEKDVMAQVSTAHSQPRDLIGSNCSGGCCQKYVALAARGSGA